MYEEGQRIKEDGAGLSQSVFRKIMLEVDFHYNMALFFNICAFILKSQIAQLYGRYQTSRVGHF